jgi:alpha-tubulin suppressor-like RCC1 family protein
MACKLSDNSLLDDSADDSNNETTSIFDKTIPFDLNGDAFGSGHTCGITSNKQVACWGWNINGQLGLGDKTDRTQPEFVLGGEQGGTYLSDIVKLAVGRDNSCAVTTTGDVYCWGLGTFNGTGAVTTDAVVPAKVVTGEQLDVSGYLTAVNNISLGYNFACATTTLQDVYCWGNGGNGRLGTGNSSSSNSPQKVLGGEQGGPYLSNIVDLNVGRATGCAVTATGELYCWGDRRGAGINTTGNQLTPARTLSGAQGGGAYLSDVKKVEVGWNISCALTNAGNVFCWGNGTTSSLGHGILEQILTPVKVLGGEQGGVNLENISELSYGFGHACAISTTNELYCWGANESLLPAKILNASSNPITNAAKVTAGPVHSCFTNQSGDVHCWGSNATGQLGNNGGASYFTTLERVLTDLID